MGSLLARLSAIAALSFALVFAQAEVRAAVVTVRGANGANGADGVPLPGNPNGKPGGAGKPATASAGGSLPVGASTNTATAIGGNGGAGGRAANHGIGGAGGAGGAASAKATTVASSGGATAEANSDGGKGGDGGFPASLPFHNGSGGGGGAGGAVDATSVATARGAGSVTSFANATGGAGGESYSRSVPGGAGGSGRVFASGSSGTGAVSVSVALTGGAGGDIRSNRGGAAGAGGAATLDDAATGSTRGMLTLTQTATGGAGGSGGHGGDGGAASSTLTVRGGSASSLAVTTVATGGAAGSGSGGGSAGAGGSASAISDAILSGSGRVSASAHATDGEVGYQVHVTGTSGAASAQSLAENANGSVKTTAQSPGVFSSPYGGSAISDTEAVVGAGSPTLVPIVAGRTVSDATLTPGGSTIGGGAMSAGATECCLIRTYSDTADFTFTTAAAEGLSLTLLGYNALETGFAALNFKVTVDGRVIAADTFTALGEAESFFSGRTLNLGVVGGRVQNVDVSYTITTGYYPGPAGGFGFDYELRDAAIPEPATWAMILLGFAGLAFARRDRGGRRAGRSAMGFTTDFR